MALPIYTEEGPVERSWERRLGDDVPEDLAREIQIFEQQIELRKQERVEEAVFAETRLRRGVYGQRYDNGQRHDGTDVQRLGYPDGALKGPNTVWDAPGMQRIKIPFGGVTTDQMDVLADISEEYADGVIHVTTRQDFQLHYVHIEDTPDIMRRLAAHGITTREACGNVVRNVTACPVAGVCQGETFDVSPYALALHEFLLGHPDAQSFGRKFKISFSGCAETACGLAGMHDLGLIARVREVDGRLERGFEMYVGGGLGAVPHQARLYSHFVPEQELLPTAQAICRVFAKHGEKKNRGRARMKFLIAKIGLDEFKERVATELEGLPDDPRFAQLPERAEQYETQPLRGPEPLVQIGAPDTSFRRWKETNVAAQKQPGYSVVTIALPLGDLSAHQMRGLAEISRRFVGDNVRTTVEQNIVLRYVRDADLPELHDALDAVGLAQPGAGTIVDVTACPGTDTCKLGIASSRGLAAELRTRLSEKAYELDEAVRGLRIKVSGCFNSCGHHHVADLGFYGVSRNKNNHLVPHFQVVLGGKWRENAGAFGLAMGAVPSKAIPEVVERVTDNYLELREGDESFQALVTRLGRAAVREWLTDFLEVPAYEDNPAFYTDWGDPREYTMKDYGVGECAGEVVSTAQFGLSESERVVFEAQVALDTGQSSKAADLAYESMLSAAKSLIATERFDVVDEPAQVVDEFKKRFFDTKLFFDPFAGGKFASYLFRQHKERLNGSTTFEQARQRIEEAQLFIEAAHGCYNRISQGGVS